ncbi:MAG: hypothetical protein IJM30_05925, partial [Thermoguttaceae bacterium]|nr:hypothetical protein [Thermoguttaceae bacterium]
LITCFRSVVKFGVERELVRPETLTALQAIAPLKRGRSVAGELPPVQAVDARIVDATREAMAGFRFREKDNKRDPGYYGKYYEAGWAPNGRKVTVPDHFLRKAKKKNKPRLERELDEAMGDYREMLAEYMRRRNYNQNLKKPK